MWGVIHILIPAETVEKDQKHDFKVYNYLILLHAKFVTMPELDFFDSLAMYRNYMNLFDIKRISQPIILSWEYLNWDRKAQYIVIHPNDNKCAITALNLAKLKP